MSQRKASAKVGSLLVAMGVILSALCPGQGLAQVPGQATIVSLDSSIAATNAQAAQYYQGEGVPKDYGKAAELFGKAAGMGSALAQFNLGYMHEKGIGLPSDYSKAYAFYQAAARQGYSAALEPLENLRQFMSAEKIAEVEKTPLPSNAPSPEASRLSDQSPVADNAELRSWLQGIKPAAGGK